MTEANNIHGLATTADSHLMKDTEWGAVAYLTQSIYGNAQISSTTGVWNNSYFEGDTLNKEITATDTDDGYTEYGTTRTGMVGSSRDNNSNYYSIIKGNKKENADGSITITYTKYNYSDGTKLTNNSGEYTNTYYTYETTNGVKGSTTGTIYGIYDMAGGAYEYQASYLSGVTGNSYVTYFNGLDNYHKTTYAGTRDAGNMTENEVTADGRYFNYLDNKEKYGNALWETSNLGTAGEGYTSWNGDSSYFVGASAPFVMRGGGFTNGSTAGLFYFNNNSGDGWTRGGFRPVVVSVAL